MSNVFEEIYKNNKWNSKESVSGTGSTLKKTKAIREFLNVFFKMHNIKSLFDVPCGDFNWLKQVNLSNINYVGWDIVKDLIDKNNEKCSSENIKFNVGDLINDKLPDSDMLLCRDCMIHLPNERVNAALKNIAKSNIEWVFLTTYPNVTENKEIKEGKWRKVNLEIAPFNLPKPVMIVDEEEKTWNSGKSIGVWHKIQLKNII